MDIAKIREIRSLIAPEAPADTVLVPAEDLIALAKITADSELATLAVERPVRLPVAYLRSILAAAETVLVVKQTEEEK